MQDSIGTEYIGIYRCQEMAVGVGALGTEFGVNKFGANEGLGAAWADIWMQGGIYTWPQTATAVSVVSDNTNDTATGSGLRSVVVEGLDSNFDQISETLTVDGATTVTGSKLFQRVNRAYALESGTYDGTTITSHGKITFTHGSTVTCLLATSTVSYGQTQIARYTVPNGFTAFWERGVITVDSGKAAHVVFWQRKNADTVTAPFTPKRLIRSWHGVQGYLPIKLTIPQFFTQKTDLWMSAIGNAAAAKTTAEFDLHLIPNDKLPSSISGV